MHSHILTLVFLLFVTSSDAQILSPKKMQKDLDALVAMLDVHPDRYHRTSAAIQDSLINAIRAELTGPLTEMQFLKKIAPLYVSIGDCNSQIYFSDKWRKNYYQKKDLFPFQLYIDEEDRVYLYDHYGQDTSIARGAEILAINDVPLKEIIRSVEKYIGHRSKAMRNSVIAYDITIFLDLYFGYVRSYRVEYWADEIISTAVHRVPLKSVDRWPPNWDLRNVRFGRNAYCLMDNEIGLLTVRHMNYAGFSADLYNIFLAVRRDSVRSLIIDLRYNFRPARAGALADLLHYISDSEVELLHRMDIKVSKLMRKKSEYLPRGPESKELVYSVNWSDLHKNALGDIVTREGVFRVFPERRPYEFNGDIFLIIDHTTINAAEVLASVIKCNQLGLLIGTETGGSHVYFDNGLVQPLKGSGLIATISSTRKYLPCSEGSESAGVIPDVIVQPTIYNLISNKDYIIPYAIHLIHKYRDNVE